MSALSLYALVSPLLHGRPMRALWCLARPMQLLTTRSVHGREPSHGITTGLGLMLAMAAGGYSLGASEQVDPAAAKGWGIGGSLQLGMVTSGGRSQINPDYSNSHHEGQRAASWQRRDGLYPLLNLRLESVDGLVFYVDTPLEEYGLALGMTAPSAWGAWDIQLYYGFEESVWDDPYALNRARQETDQQRVGGSLALNQIAETSLSLEYTLRRIAIDDDRAAKRDEHLGRAGWDHCLSLSAPWALDGTQLITAVEGRWQDREGRAASALSVNASVAWVIPWQHWQLMLNIEAGHAHYQDQHPVFGRRRRDLQWGAGGMLSHRGLLGLSGVTTGALAAWEAIDSTTPFYDQQAWFAGLVLGYDF